MSHDEKTHEQLPLYYRGLIMGLLLGIVGNLFVSYIVETLDFFETPLWAWVLGTIFSLVGILVLVWRMDKEIKRLIMQKKEGVKS